VENNKVMTEKEKKLREEYFDGPASDYMSLQQFFLSKGLDVNT
tara:strand:+ start:5273 stop:5401 length:129 start_codon:yes stop_codon:yes gene_type:complete